MAALEASGVGSIPAILTNNVPVAQLVEHSPEEPGVGGSIPSGYTITHTALETRCSTGKGLVCKTKAVKTNGFDSRTCLPSSMKIVVDIRLQLL